MSDDDSLAAWLRLTLIPGIGGETQRRLLAAFGSPEAVFAAGRSALSGVIGSAAASRLIDADVAARVEQALAWQSSGERRHFVALGDADYPPALLAIADPPSLLYVCGQRERLALPSLAIVGSRNATPAGALTATQFAAALADAGLAIVSGLALGIDGAAHRGALAAGGTTIAVIGTGIDRIYPAQHEALAREIAERGVIVSEFPLASPPLPGNFPRRNRLIAGLARGVLVVEAALGSGSLITARLAADQGREVFAIPGSIHSPQSRGCHRLLRDGAKLVETAADILEELRWSSPAPHHAPATDTALYSETEQKLLAALGHAPCAIDELARRSGLTAAELSVILLQLELAGHVAGLPGGRYQRLPRQ
jgi:DNA processing protein